MGHPEIDNRTPFAFQALFASDEEDRPLVAPLVKASYDILEGGALELADEQVPVDLSGESFGEPGQSSYRTEPEIAFVKPATDVVLIGHAHAPSGRATEGEVRFRVGPVGRRIRVVGDRVWAKRLIGSAATPPQPFEKIPLQYERAYGGPGHGGNPVGVGFRAKRAPFEEGARLPNLEDPDALLTSYTGKSQPAGFGFTCPHWEPRRFLAGTYDAAWSRTRMPLLPRDFDRRFFNAASPGLVGPGYLRGDDPVLVQGASPEGRISFRLPGLIPPVCRLGLRHGGPQTLATNLDTVIVDLDARKLLLLWRGFVPLWDGPLDVSAIEVSAENAPARRASEPLPANVVPLAGRRAA